MARQLAQTEVGVVREFLGALEAVDVDRATALLDPAAVYQNVPFPPAEGREEIVRQLRMFARYARSFEVRYLNVAAEDETVLTERVDIIGLGPVRWRFWVCGTFVVRDGRIVLWRDRFDFVNLLWGLARGAGKAALGRGGTPAR